MRASNGADELDKGTGEHPSANRSPEQAPARMDRGDKPIICIGTLQQSVPPPIPHMVTRVPALRKRAALAQNGAEHADLLYGIHDTLGMASTKRSAYVFFHALPAFGRERPILFA